MFDALGEALDMTYWYFVKYKPHNISPVFLYCISPYVFGLKVSHNCYITLIEYHHLSNTKVTQTHVYVSRNFKD